MRRIYCHIALLVTIVLIASGCQLGTAPLSAQQIQEFIHEKNIKPLTVEEAGRNVTVILFKDSEKVGCYVVWARNGLETSLQTTELVASQQDAVARPITAIYDSVFGTDIICMTINSFHIRQQAQTMKVIFQDGQEMSLPIRNQGDMIISRKSDAVRPNVDAIFYDKDQKEILRVALWGRTEIQVK